MVKLQKCLVACATAAAAATAVGAAPAAVASPALRAAVVHAARGSVHSASATPRAGYRLSAGDGGIFTFGSATFLGSASARCASRQCWGFAATPDGHGYWVLDTDPAGTAYGFGTASDMTNLDPLATVIVSDATGQGGWLLDGTSGRVTTFGDAHWYGDASGIGRSDVYWPPYGSSIDYFQGMAATVDGKGYWIVGADGGVFSFGDARFYGSVPGALGAGRHLLAPVSGIARSDDGKGYWLVAYDGGVFAFGDAGFAGSMAGRPLNDAMISIAGNPDGPGYWTASLDGGVFSFGGAPFLGSMAGKRLNRPVYHIAATAG